MIATFIFDYVLLCAAICVCIYRYVRIYICYAPEKIPETPVFLKSGCDSPEEVAEPPVLHLPSPRPSIMPVGQVRQFSWHYSDKHGLSDVRQKLGKNNKQINSSSLFPPSQGTSRLQGPPPSSHSED